MPPAPEPVRSMRVRALHAPSTCRAYINAKPNPLPAPDPLPYPADCTTSTVDRATSTHWPLTVDRKFDQVHFDLFSCPDSIFYVCFSIRNLDMLGDKISRPIHVIFYGDNFSRWSQAMRSYLKGRKLWLYVSGDCPIPEKEDKETDSAHAIRIEDWDSVNHHIITRFRNTSISSIYDEFGNIDIAKEVWDLLVTRYAGLSGARKFKLTRKFYQIRQEPGEQITVYHSRLKSIWDQLIASEPLLSNSTDIKLVYAHREQGRLFQFLMGLRDEFESARSHILHQDPLPTVSQAIHKLVDDETRL